MKHYSVVSVTPRTEEWIPTYVSAVGPLAEKYGGKCLARTASHRRIEGGGVAPTFQVIMEWPSKEAESAFYADPDYRDHLAARLNGADCVWSSIEGKDDYAS